MDIETGNYNEDELKMQFKRKAMYMEKIHSSYVFGFVWTLLVFIFLIGYIHFYSDDLKGIQTTMTGIHIILRFLSIFMQIVDLFQITKKNSLMRNMCVTDNIRDNLDLLNVIKCKFTFYIVLCESVILIVSCAAFEINFIYAFAFLVVAFVNIFDRVRYIYPTRFMAN